MSQNIVLFFILIKIIAISHCSPFRDFKNVEMHPNCRNLTYCFDRGDDYPETLIDILVNSTNISQIDSATPEHRQTSHSILNPCEANYTVGPIYQVRVHGKVRYVVQSTRIKQIVHVATCKNKGEITQNYDYLNVVDLKREYYQTAYCVESYTNYRFLVLAEDGKRLETVRAKGIPVCCRCVIHPTDQNVEFYFNHF